MDFANQNQLAVIQEERAVQAHTESSKAVQEIQGMIISAKKFPRDELGSYNRIMKSCQRLSLADQAVYRIPIGGKTQEGPSIRLAEVLAQAWGNLSFGIKEISRTLGKSLHVAYCHDYETNTRAEIEFEVEHWIEVGKQGQVKTKKHITDPVEIDRLIANRGARKLRNCILNIIPPDVIEEAVKACKTTVAKGGGEPIEDRVRKMIMAFDGLGVSKEMVQEFLGHDLEITTGEEIANLSAIYKSITDKQAKRSDYFNTGEEEKEKTSTLNSKLKKERTNEKESDKKEGDKEIDQAENESKN